MNSRYLFDLDKASKDKAKQAADAKFKEAVKDLLKYIHTAATTPDFTIDKVEYWFCIGTVCGGVPRLPAHGVYITVSDKAFATEVIDEVIAEIRKTDPGDDKVCFSLDRLEHARCGRTCDCLVMKPVFCFKVYAPLN